MNREDMKKKKKRRRRHPALRVFLFLLLLVVVGVGGYAAWAIYHTMDAANESYDDLGREKSKLRDYAVNISNDPVSILLLGIEDYSSGGKGGRSDTIMVATFNPEDQSMKLLSIPRDARVEVPGIGLDKINHAYSKRGKEATIETVEDFLEIPIDYYATINFDGLKNIVDIVGGITVDVPQDFTQNSDDPKAEKLKFYEGPMDLDGRHALAYARMRKQDNLGDIGRNARQQDVVKAIIDEIASAGTLLKVDKLTDEVGKNVETNLKVTELLGFYQKYAGFNSNNIETVKLEGYPETIDGLDYWILEEESVEEVQDELKAHLDIKTYSSSSSYSRESK